MLKNAIVVPINKSELHKDAGNHTPISILSIFSELLEKPEHVPFINWKTMLHSIQFDFRPGKFTSFTITDLLSSLLVEYNANTRTVLALLDLQTAFDFINHELLLNFYDVMV